MTILHYCFRCVTCQTICNEKKIWKNKKIDLVSKNKCLDHKKFRHEEKKFFWPKKSSRHQFLTSTFQCQLNKKPKKGKKERKAQILFFRKIDKEGDTRGKEEGIIFANNELSLSSEKESNESVF